MRNRSSPIETAQLEMLYSEYGQWLSDRAKRRFGHSIADDLVQEVWLKLASLETTAAIRHPRAFLMRVVANAAVTQARRTRHETASLATNEGAIGAHQEQSVLLRQVILGLPQPLRDVFVMSRFGGLSNAQIAEQLGISPKTVEWRMTKALAHCAAQLRA